MKFAVIGLGAVGRGIIQDLMKNPEVEEILIADSQKDKVNRYTLSFNDPRIRGAFVDAHNTAQTANAVRGSDVTINSAHYDTNIDVMKACLKAKSHYNDSGNMFHFSRKQLELFEDFKRAGLSAVFGIGFTPGISNVVSRYVYDRLDHVESVHFSFAGGDLKNLQVFNNFSSLCSIKTMSKVFSSESVQFIDGRYKIFPSLSGGKVIAFPEPIGRSLCFYTLHSELATIPHSFKEKGIKEVSWRLSLPHEFRKKCILPAPAGFCFNETIRIKAPKVRSREILAALEENNFEEKVQGGEADLIGISCLRTHMIGKKDNKEVEYVVDCLVTKPSKLPALIAYSAAISASIVAQMQAAAIIEKPGVWAPEQLVDPEYFFAELAKRDFQLEVRRFEDNYTEVRSVAAI